MKPTFIVGFSYLYSINYYHCTYLCIVMPKSFTIQQTPVYHDTATGEPVMNIAGNVTQTTPTGTPIVPFINGNWDNVTQTRDTLTDTWVFKTGSTILYTVVITYTTASKDVISTVVKS